MSSVVMERHREILSAGVDWLTCSKRDGVLGSDFQRLGDELVRGAKQSGARTRLDVWQGYAGLRGENFFYGQHGGAAVVTLSGPHAAPLIADFIHAADNVSRIDLQVTVEHLPPEPELGRINFNQLAGYECRPGVRPVCTQMYDTKGGHTNAVGARISDAYGRNYDKGIESKLCEQGRLWRYEVEFKRGRAKRIARQIALSYKPELDVARTVWHWWASRGVLLVAKEPYGCLIDTRLPERNEVDYLAYFENNVASSIRAAVARHGLPAVLRALGLRNQVKVLGDTKEE